MRWQLWSPETLALARKHNRVLFVSIGYSACHCAFAPLRPWLAGAVLTSASLRAAVIPGCHVSSELQTDRPTDRTAC